MSCDYYLPIPLYFGQERFKLDTPPKLVQKSRAIVLDIEGTISALDFVREKLFPYARLHLEEYIMTHWKDEDVQEAFIELQKQALLDDKEDPDRFIPIIPHVPSINENSVETEKSLRAIIDNIRWQMDHDRKTTGLKKIQGLIWRVGYENKGIIGHLYEDVIDALNTWKSEGKDIFIYSSGSREAQLNLLKYSIFGDVTKYFREFFDTTIGSKFESSSYRYICDYADKRPQEIVFFTDSPKEIVAAKKCGLKTILVVRNRHHDLNLIFKEADFCGYEDGGITSFKDIKCK